MIILIPYVIEAASIIKMSRVYKVNGEKAKKL